MARGSGCTNGTQAQARGHVGSEVIDTEHIQHRSIAYVGRLNVVLVTKGSNGLGIPRVQLETARYPYKLNAVEAREIGLGLIAGADALLAKPPVAEEGTFGPQATTLAFVGWSGHCVAVDLIEQGADNRGKRRVSLHVHGSRYPYSLDGEAARTIGNGLVAAAGELEAQ